MRGPMDGQVEELRTRLICELQHATSLLTEATVHVARDDFTEARLLTRAAASISLESARAADVLALLR